MSIIYFHIILIKYFLIYGKITWRKFNQLRKLCIKILPLLKFIKFKDIKNGLLLGLKKAPADVTKAKILYFYGPKFDDHTVFELYDSNNLINHEKFNPLNKTVLYLHGYLEKLTDESNNVIINAYLQRHDYNILYLDWSELADGNYLFDAVPNAKQLGQVLARILMQLFNNGLNINKLHLVGHSLGGQLIGIIGREVKKKSNGTLKLARLTALDPAFPPFYTGGLTRHLSKSDAEFVDVIHTDAWLYGAPFSTGTVDFWPNGGKTLQPGCPRRNYKPLSDNDLCSHRRSWYFWAESVSQKYPDKFIAIKTKSWKDFKMGHIDNVNDKIIMGIDTPTDASGDYYLQTNGQTPFARGEKGIIYTPYDPLINGNDR